MEGPLVRGGAAGAAAGAFVEAAAAGVFVAAELVSLRVERGHSQRGGGNQTKGQ